MLTHTSGLGEAPCAAAAHAHTLADLIPLYLAAPMQFEPGATWSYCQSGMNTGSRVVEVVSGMSFGSFLQQRIFDPLGNGGLFSTGPDDARFCQMLLAGETIGGRHYLSPEAMKFLQTVQTGELATGFI